MNFDLPATGAQQPPAFRDPAQYGDWRRNLPLSSPVLVQVQLHQQLDLLNRFDTESANRLALLEAMREDIRFAQESCAKKFAGKPLPLAPAEQAASDASHGLWQAQCTGYLHCLSAAMGGDAGCAAQAALICQRALAALTDDMIDVVQSGKQPGGELWRRAHAIHTCAETLAVRATPAEDNLRAGQPVTPMAAYVELMLLSAASLHELPARQQLWVVRWARRWAGKVNVVAEPLFNSPALPLCVDLEGDEPAGFKPRGDSGARWLDTTELRKSLKLRLTRLARGEPEDTPARLGLGEDCTQPACGEVLRRTYPHWVKGGILRRHERHPMSGGCRFTVGIDAIHYYVSGHLPFKPPGSVSTAELRRQQEELATFGRIGTRFEDEYSHNHGYQLESWEVIEDWGMLDQSSGGLRLVRPLAQGGGRLASGQLVAVQPAGSSVLLLGMVRWVQVTGDQLSAGILMLPGKPVPVAQRGTGVMAARESYRPGFLLTAGGTGQAPAVVMAPGQYKPDRIIEAWTELVTYRLKLKSLIERGADFELASYEEMPP